MRAQLVQNAARRTTPDADDTAARRPSPADGTWIAPVAGFYEHHHNRGGLMSNVRKRAAGTAKELQGKVEKNVGKLVRSERLEAEGRARELAGQAEKESAKRKERVKGAVEEVSGRVEGAVGELVDDPETSARGQLRKAKGKARQATNR
jgi:uncharacterized protein YjbJ (UPF0337 family)